MLAIKLGATNENNDSYYPISQKLSKYKTKQPGEVYIKENETKTKRIQRYNQKIAISGHIIAGLRLQGTQKTRLEYLLSDIKDLKDLCRNCSQETIITALAFYIKKTDNPRVQIKDYKICKEHNLTINKYAVIVTKLALHFQAKKPVPTLCPIQY